MKTYTKLNENPEQNTVALTRITASALTHVVDLFGDEDMVDGLRFRPQDVAKIVIDHVCPRILKAREIAELERDIAELKLARALARIQVLEEAARSL